MLKQQWKFDSIGVSSYCVVGSSDCNNNDNGGGCKTLTI